MTFLSLDLTNVVCLCLNPCKCKKRRAQDDYILFNSPYI